MPTTRHIIVCEGESEWAYLQRLQGFLDDQELAPNTFETPLRFVSPERAIAKGGTFGKLKSHYSKTRKSNSKASIQIWADFDLYHRNDKNCADNYAAKTAGIPDFLFSFHNFEDFFALHFDGPELAQWLHLAVLRANVTSLRLFIPRDTFRRLNVFSRTTPRADCPQTLCPGLL